MRYRQQSLRQLKEYFDDISSGKSDIEVLNKALAQDCKQFYQTSIKKNNQYADNEKLTILKTLGL